MNASSTTPAPAGTSGARILTIPNALSALRLAAVPVFVYLFVTGRENLAVAIYAAAAWTDFLDGYIARRTGAITELGKFLDPLADRVLILALAIALVARETLPLWLAAVIVARDLLVLAVFPALERRGMERLPVNFAGKLATAMLLFGLTCLALSETSFTLADEGEEIGMVFSIMGAIVYWFATALYAREARARLRALTTTRSAP